MRRRITVVDPTGSKKTRVEVPPDVRTDRLTQALVRRMGHPELNQGGRPISYRLSYNRDGEETALNPEETLDDAGIQDDDVLRLYADMQGGGGPAPPLRGWRRRP